MRIIDLADLTISKFYGVVESALNHDHGEFWLMGGRASLKSSVISLLIVCLIVAFPWANAVVVRRFGNTLRDSVYAQIIWAIDILGLSSFFRARVSPMEIVYVPTGQKIVFRGMDDPLKMKGVKFVKGYCAIQWFEELDRGSSPRMRGTRTLNGQAVVRNGIIPRMRGTLNSTSGPSVSTGIIPAYAGNTGAFQFALARTWDHPRVCGEHPNSKSLTLIWPLHQLLGNLVECVLVVKRVKLVIGIDGLLRCFVREVIAPAIFREIAADIKRCVPIRIRHEERHPLIHEGTS
mgnify:CR=1 FL=1|nr:MAG TPA: large terminase [Caudoviricetes sp.]